MLSQKKVTVSFVCLSHEHRESTWLLTCNHISSPWNSWSVACKTLSWVAGASNRSKLYLIQIMGTFPQVVLIAPFGVMGNASFLL